MSSIPNDPIEGGLAKFAKDLRVGLITSESATRAYLDRIRALDPKLGAYQYVNEEKAIATAKAMDSLLKNGLDLGPLMGVPIAIKDVFNINGYPAPKAGTLADLSGILPPGEGSFISALRKSGVVILGTTKAVEFCLGITGVSKPLGTPWNPFDANKQRIPGGSSSGSGVACSAGLCAFAIGTDSGGSVRVPAAYNGLFGFKTSFGWWPNEGAIPLDPSVDTIGILSHTARDAKIVFDTIESLLRGYKYEPYNKKIDVASLKFGKPANIFYDDLDADVSAATSLTEKAIIQAGGRFEDFNYLEASERTQYFPLTMPVSVIAMLGRNRFEKDRPVMDDVVGDRVASGLDVSAVTLMERQQQRSRSIDRAREYFNNFDVIACPTTATVAPYVSDFEDHEQAMKYALGMTRNTQPANYLGQCAVSLPINVQASGQPMGYQLIAAPMDDKRLLNIAVAIESVLNTQVQPDLTKYSSS